MPFYFHACGVVEWIVTDLFCCDVEALEGNNRQFEKFDTKPRRFYTYRAER
jgi:hypothetical protein